MKCKYDVIIIGATLEGIRSAKFASKLGARVALIVDVDFDSPCAQRYIFNQLQNQLLSSAYFHHRREIVEETKTLIIQQYLPELQTLEVDLIFSSFDFVNHQKSLSIKTNQDILVANRYLLATSSFLSSYSTIKGIDQVGYLRGYDIFQQYDLNDFYDDIVIIGEDAIAFNLATILSQANKKVTLLTESNFLLPQEEKEISFLIQSQLEVRGVKIYNNCDISQVKSIDNRKWIQAGDKAIDTEEIILTNSYLKTKINPDNLSLKQTGINLYQGKIVVNNRLQTYHPKIYSCGNLLGGYNLPTLSALEGEIALKNALFFPLEKIDYSFIPYTLQTNPSITRIGYTESQAKNIYGDLISTIKVNTDFISFATLENQVGLLKIILNNDKKIIGCHLWGNYGQNLIPIFSLLIKNHKTIYELFQIKVLDDTSQKIIEQIKEEWQKINQNQFRIDFLQTWFIWKRV